MELDQGAKRTKYFAFLLGRGGVGTTFFPRPLERFRIHGTAESTNEKQKGYVQKKTSRSHSKMKTPGILIICYLGFGASTFWVLCDLGKYVSYS